jgi:hypothetical protein
MDQINDNASLINIKRLSNNEDFYNKVFKKTERIVSAVFYILSHIATTETTKVHSSNLSDKALAAHEAVTASLSLFEYDVKEGIYPLQHALVVLESALTVASSARLISSDIATSVADEIDLVLRHIRNHYTEETMHTSAHTSIGTSPTPRLTRPRRTRPQIPKNDMSSDAIFVYSDLSDRTTRIKTVLEAKPEATIKDLTDIITDVSAKTIQRDLNSLIERGEVIRQGERRWSKYSLA